MTSRLSMSSTGHSRGRRASVAEVIRRATTNSGLSRVFTRIKSVPKLNSRGESPIVTGDGNTARATGLRDPNSVANQDFPFLNISPPTAQSPSRDINIELGALGIIFPQSPTPNDGGFSPIPPTNVDTTSAWIEFCVQSENNRRREHSVAEPASVIGTVESTDGMATPLGAATSSMTLMDPEICSQDSTPREGEEGESCIGALECDQELRLIGDEVVLKYILDGMGPFEEPCLSLGIQEESKIDSGHKIVPKTDTDTPSAFALTVPSLDKALPALRHRKDPPYEEPPSISLITATPQCSIRERHEHFSIPPSNSAPVALLTPYYSRYGLSYPTRHQNQPEASCNFAVLQQRPNTAYVCGSYDSIFLESEFAVTRHASSSTLIPTELKVVRGSEVSQSGPGPTNHPPDEHTTDSTVFNSLIRKLGGGIYSIFRFGRSTTKEEIRPDEALSNRGHVEWGGSEMRSSNNERRLYSLQSALDISLPVERN